MLRYTLVVKELLCGATMETETPQNRSRAVEFLTACLPIRSAIHSKLEHNFEEMNGVDRLICKSPPCDAPPACPRPYPLHHSIRLFREEGGGRKALVVMLPGSRIVQIVLKPSQTQQHIHSLGSVCGLTSV